MQNIWLKIQFFMIELNILNHFAGDYVMKGEICVQDISSPDHITDVLTKPLGTYKLQYLRVELMVLPRTSI